jgi:hypothetical protein
LLKIRILEHEKINQNHRCPSFDHYRIDAGSGPEIHDQERTHQILL